MEFHLYDEKDQACATNFETAIGYAIYGMEDKLMLMFQVDSGIRFTWRPVMLENNSKTNPEEIPHQDWMVCRQNLRERSCSDGQKYSKVQRVQQVLDNVLKSGSKKVAVLGPKKQGLNLVVVTTSQKEADRQETSKSRFQVLPNQKNDDD